MSYSISMRIGRHELRSRPGMTLAVLTVVAVCVSLGIWQLQRAAEKSALAELLGERLGQPPLAITDFDASRIDALRYARVEVRGRYEFDHQFHIPHRLHRRTQGTHIITPFRIADGGRTLLVNRGWVPAEQATTAPPPPAATATLTVTGRLVAPAAPPLRLGPANSDDKPWGQPWLFADPQLFAERSGETTLPMILLLDPGVPNGFARDWTLPRPEPGMHYGYAIQWFAFALIAVIVWVALSRKKEPFDP